MEARTVRAIQVLHEQDDWLAELERVQEERARLLAREIELAGALEDGAAEFQGLTGTERFLQLDLAGTWKVSQGAAASRMARARRFREVLTGTLDLLAEAGCTVEQAQALERGTVDCTDEVAREVERLVLDRLGSYNLVDLRRKVAKTVLAVESRLDAEAAERRRREAVEDRSMWHRALPDGMALVGGTMTAADLARFLADFDELARREEAAEREAGGSRTVAQLRADLFADLPALVLYGCPGRAAPAEGPAETRSGGSWLLDLVLTGAFPGPRPGRPRTVVQVQIPVLTALGLGHAPGHVVGVGPISGPQARLLIPSADLQRVLVNYETGVPVHLDPRIVGLIHPDRVADLDPLEQGHDPSAATAAFVDLRDVSCDGPGCAQPARRCERDHMIPWPEGPTRRSNLKDRSPRCHHAKHAGWTVQTFPDGSSIWTSRTGRRYYRAGPHDPPELLEAC